MGILALNSTDFGRILLLNQNTLSDGVISIKIVTRSATKQTSANLFYSVRLRSLLKLLMPLAQ
jgi:hypothetical protein